MIVSLIEWTVCVVLGVVPVQNVDFHNVATFLPSSSPDARQYPALRRGRMDGDGTSSLKSVGKPLPGGKDQAISTESRSLTVHDAQGVLEIFKEFPNK